MTSRLPSRRLCPGLMESEASEGERGHRLTSASHCLLRCQIQQDGVSYCNRYDIAHLGDVHEQEAWFIQPVLSLLIGGSRMPYIQMHVGSTKRHCGNIVRFVHQAHSCQGRIFFI